MEKFKTDNAISMFYKGLTLFVHDAVVKFLMNFETMWMIQCFFIIVKLAMLMLKSS